MIYFDQSAWISGKASSILGPALSLLGENFERHAPCNCSAKDDKHHATFLAYKIWNTSHSFLCEWQPSIPIVYRIVSLACIYVPQNGRLLEIEHPSRTAWDVILQTRSALPFGKIPKSHTYWLVMLPVTTWPRSHRQIRASDTLMRGAQRADYENSSDHSQSSFQDQEDKGKADALNASRAQGVTGKGGITLFPR